LIKVLNHIFK